MTSPRCPRPRPCPSSPALRPRPPGSCISAAPARRCSTGCSRTTTAAPSCCASRIPTGRARHPRRSRGSSRPCAGSTSPGMGPRSTSPRTRRATRRSRTSSWPRATPTGCYCTPEELTEMRERARKAGGTRLYDGRWRDRDPAEAPAGIDPVVRIKMPLEGETVIADAVQGEVRVANERLDDLVLLRADGTPTLHALGRRRRPRHGRDPHHPRRRPPDERVSPAPDLRRVRLAGADLRPHSADPRARRRQAVEAPRRPRRRGLSQHGLPARGAHQLPAAARLGPRRR